MEARTSGTVERGLTAGLIVRHRHTHCLLLALTLFLVSARQGWAEFGSPCGDRKALAGRVKTVEVSEGKIKHDTGKPSGGRFVKSSTDWSKDGRMITTVTYESDGPFQAWLRMYPTTNWNYDAAGRLIRRNAAPQRVHRATTDAPTINKVVPRR